MKKHNLSPYDVMVGKIPKEIIITGKEWDKIQWLMGYIFEQTDDGVGDLKKIRGFAMDIDEIMSRALDKAQGEND